MAIVVMYQTINGNPNMTKEKSEERSSDSSGAKKKRPGGTSENDHEWYHEASDTESEVLRAMIGKLGEVDEEDGDEMDDGDEQDNLSEK